MQVASSNEVFSFTLKYCLWVYGIKEMNCKMTVGQEACNVQTFSITLVCEKVSSTFGSLWKVHLVAGIDLFLVSAVWEKVM
jgi:hypothetical protein